MRFILITTFTFILANSFCQTPFFHKEGLAGTTYDFYDMPHNARISGFGDISVVSPEIYPDAGNYRNPALISKFGNFSGIYSGYIKIDNEHDYYLNFNNGIYHSFDDKHKLALSFNYMRYKKEDYFSSFKLSYNHCFNKNLSAGFSFKQNFTQEENEININPYSFDLGLNYGKLLNKEKNIEYFVNYGFAINNIGPKRRQNLGIIIFNENHERIHKYQYFFQTTNLLLGALFEPQKKLSDNEMLILAIGYQIEKQLVPSTPKYKDELYRTIESGKDPDVSAFKGMYQSLYDSPYGIDGELSETSHKLGLELRLQEENLKSYFAVRFGMHRDSYRLGELKYNTIGSTFNVAGVSLDLMKFISTGNDDKIGYYYEPDELNNWWMIMLSYKASLKK